MNDCSSGPTDAPDAAPCRATLVAALRQHLHAAKALRQNARGDPASEAARQQLRAWQAERLAKTHADLLASPRCGAAARFFLSDLYGPKDFSRRDEEVERLLPLLNTILPPSALEAIGLAIEVDALTESLDSALLARLKKKGQPLQIDDNGYAAAYRALDRNTDRLRQIALIRQTGETLRKVAATPLIGVLLRMMRIPAQRAGLGELQAFLEHGLDAFRAMGDAAPRFLELIEQRETALHHRLMQNQPAPFCTAEENGYSGV